MPEQSCVVLSLKTVPLSPGNPSKVPRGDTKASPACLALNPRNWRLQTGLKPLGFTPPHAKALTEALESVKQKGCVRVFFARTNGFPACKISQDSSIACWHHYRSRVFHPTPA